MTSNQKRAVWAGVVGTMVASLVVLRILVVTGWDPTVFVAFGEDAAPTREYAEELLGPVHLRSSQGHDGKYFFVQANDPWFVDAEETASILDRPLYRSQRMLYPVLASAGGLMGPEAVVWGLLVVNLLAMGFGTWAVAQLALQMGGSAWWGLAFTLNLGFISEITIDGAGVVSAGLAFLALVMVLRDRLIPALALLAMAALAREAMLIAAAGTAFWLWRESKRKEALFAISVPIAAVAIWALYLRIQVGFESGAAQVQELGLPLVGFFGAFSNWISDPLDLAVGLAMLVLMALYTWRAVTSKTLLGWAFLGFVPLGVLFTRQVWNSWFDISRAIAPAITAYVLLFLLDVKSRRSVERGNVTEVPV